MLRLWAASTQSRLVMATPKLLMCTLKVRLTFLMKTEMESLLIRWNQHKALEDCLRGKRCMGRESFVLPQRLFIR